MRFAFRSLLISLSLPIFGQPDTIFLNPEGQKCLREAAEVYRLNKKTSEGFVIKDYYVKSHILQMQAHASSLEPEVLHGPASYYHPDGTKSHEGWFDNNAQTGIWKYWESATDSTLLEFKGGDIVFLNKGHYIPLRGKKQFVLTEGSGAPTVVFITGKAEVLRISTRFLEKLKGVPAYLLTTGPDWANRNS